MARITSKTNWEAGDGPRSSDFNRIENNNAQAFDEIDVIVSGEKTFSGNKTFSNGIIVDTITSSTSNGVVIDGVTIKSGAVVGTVWGA
jgi:hypothetical protein